MNTLRLIFRKITENFWLKLLSLFFAFFLWIVVVSIDNPVMTLPFSSIPVTVENAVLMEKDGKSFELADSSKTVTVNVRAERSVLSELSRDNFKATIDMSHLDGDRVPIEVKATKYADKIQSITPRQEFAKVTVEDLQKAQFKIHVETTGTAAEGYTVGTTSIENNVIRVSGPASVVSTINRAEVGVNVSGLTGEILSTEEILLLDGEGDIVDASSLDLSITHTLAKVEIWQIKKVPIHYGVSGTPADGFAFTGATASSLTEVSVTAADSILQKVTEISIPSDAINLDGAKETLSKTLSLSNYLPGGVRLAYPEEESEISISAFVEELTIREITVPVSYITPDGVPSGMMATILAFPEYITSTIRGLKDDLDKMDVDAVTGIADLSGVEAGEDGKVAPDVYNALVKLNLPDRIDQVSVSEVRVLLQIDVNSGVSENTAAEAPAGADDSIE